MPNAEEQAFWSGTEETYALKPLFIETSSREGAPVGASLSPLPSPGASAPLRSAFLSVRPIDGIGATGQETNVDILVNDVEGLAESMFTVTYDPKVLEFRQAREGEFLKRNGTAIININADPGIGKIVVQLKRGEAGLGVTGSGVLASLAFVGKAPGVSQIGLEAPRLVTAGKAVLSATSGQGVLRVR
jgi:hypothetical protein